MSRIEKIENAMKILISEGSTKKDNLYYIELSIELEKIKAMNNISCELQNISKILTV